MKADYALYLVTDESVALHKMLNIVEEAVHGGVTIVQLREKKSEGKKIFAKAQQLKQLLDRYDVPLIINDRVDIALAVDAAGVHVGQQDMPLPAVKKIVPASMIVGVSAATVDEARAAEQDGADYIGVGAVFPTTTKDDTEVLEEGMLEKIVQSVTIPAVAIGGIQRANVSKLRGKGLSGCAVVSAIMRAADPRQTAEQLKTAWR